MASVFSQIPLTDSRVPLRGLKANLAERLTLVAFMEEFENPTEGSFLDPDWKNLPRLLQEASVLAQISRSLLMAMDGWERPE